jgi:hypothetical protein
MDHTVMQSGKIKIFEIKIGKYKHLLQVQHSATVIFQPHDCRVFQHHYQCIMYMDYTSAWLVSFESGSKIQTFTKHVT